MKSLRDHLTEGLMDKIKNIKNKAKRILNTKLNITGNVITSVYYPQLGEGKIGTQENIDMLKGYIDDVNNFVSKITKTKVPYAECLSPYSTDYVFETKEEDETILNDWWEEITDNFNSYFKSKNMIIERPLRSDKKSAKITAESKINPNLAVEVEIYF